MRYQILPTAALSSDLRDSVINVATLAFRNMPREQLLKRFESYQYLGVAKHRGRVVAFSFLSEHVVDDDYFIGFRLSATHPDFQGQGVLSRVTRRLLWRRVFAYWWRRLTSFRDRSRLFVFCRVCNPLAYKAIHLGQAVYPDLITGESARVAPSMRRTFESLSGVLGIDGLDPATGLIAGGAASVGIRADYRDVSLREQWNIPWQEAVPPGSELLVVAPLAIGNFHKYVVDSLAVFRGQLVARFSGG